MLGVSTRNLNRLVRRRAALFPEDLAFQLSPEEWIWVWCPKGTTYKRPKKNPGFVFTESGVVLAATLLRGVKSRRLLGIVRLFARERQARRLRDIVEGRGSAEQRFEPF